ncbi:hypothetical protein RM812_41945, partial [Streptomyces sp. DSM 40712]|nr:hypothetical protein [Streptomyces sp. DSM 40712]
MTIDQAPAGQVPTVMHVRCPDRPPELYRLLLEQLAELSPVVQALPPTAALAELKGALRCHGVGADVDRLGQMLRVRTLTRCGADLRIGIGPTISVAATASAQVPEPGGVLVVAPDRAAEWLAGLPVEALHGIGPRQAGVLHDYGIHTRCWARPTGGRERSPGSSTWTRGCRRTGCLPWPPYPTSACASGCREAGTEAGARESATGCPPAPGKNGPVSCRPRTGTRGRSGGAPPDSPM